MEAGECPDLVDTFSKSCPLLCIPCEHTQPYTLPLRTCSVSRLWHDEVFLRKSLLSPVLDTPYLCPGLCPLWVLFPVWNEFLSTTYSALCLLPAGQHALGLSLSERRFHLEKQERTPEISWLTASLPPLLIMNPHFSLAIWDMHGKDSWAADPLCSVFFHYQGLFSELLVATPAGPRDWSLSVT